MNPVKTLVIYRPKAGSEEALMALVQAHWSILNKVGLSTSEPAIVYRALNKRTGAISIVEIFSWRDEEASVAAHHDPEVKTIWGPMMPILDSMEISALHPAN